MNDQKQFQVLSFLFFFLFGGAIVGETVSLTFAVSAVGPAILSKLYLINGILLFLLPALFFKNIDTVNRGKLLSALLLLTAALLTVYLIVFQVLQNSTMHNEISSFLILTIYPVSYMSKTILFLTFWTFANDIYSTDDAKKGFPVIAAWGFVGGLSGACIGRLLLEKIDAKMIIGVWIAAYSIGWYFSRKATEHYRTQLLKRERNAQNLPGQNLFAGLGSVLDLKLIRLISVLYFCVFVAIFMQDYYFLKKSAALFTTSNSLAGFLFSFYIIHGIATIAGLRFAVPSMIYKWGVTRIFVILPIALFAGSLLMIGATLMGGSARVLFGIFLAVQFSRYIAFENAFSPIYQMFFAAVPTEKRGRAKTFLEGIIKPSAIMLTGAAIMVVDANRYGIMTAVLIVSSGMVVIVLRLRKTNLEALISKIGSNNPNHEVMLKIGSHHDRKILSLLKEYSCSGESDVRLLCVKMLARDGSKRAFKLLVDIFNVEQNRLIKQTIAASMKKYSMIESMPFIIKMLTHSDSRIRANAVFSIAEMDCLWKGQLHDLIRQMASEKSPRIKIETARYLWEVNGEGDRALALTIAQALLSSSTTNKRSAGIYLVGVLKHENWEDILLENLQSASQKVFENCIEAIFRSASNKTRMITLQTIEKMTRKHITLLGKILRTIGMPAFDATIDFLRNAQSQRMIVEIIRTLRAMVESKSSNTNGPMVDNATKIAIADMTRRDLEQTYKDGFIWWGIIKNLGEKANDDVFKALDDGLRDQLLRACERSLDVMALLDDNNILAAVRREFNPRDLAERREMAEIIEGISVYGIAQLVVPILRSETWEDLAKIGKHRFHFEPVHQKETMDYFVQSKNRWVCFCALYVLCKTSGKRRLGAAVHAIIMTLQHCPNIYLSRVARQLAAKDGDNREGLVEDFELLERVMALKKTALFHAIAAEKLMGVAEISQGVSYKAGTLISREGEVSDHLYIVRSGSLKIVKSKNNLKTILSILRAGETYGEIGLFNQAPRGASAIAQEDCELWVIQRSSLKKLLLDMPELAYNFLEAFSEKLSRNSEELLNLRVSNMNTKKEYLNY
jgi:CRP-like cAMP-binding protein